jgi:twitching motility protein PilU
MAETHVYEEKLRHVLAAFVKSNGSDLFLSVGFPPAMKVNGQMVKMGDHLLTRAEVQGLIDALESTVSLGSAHKDAYDTNFAYQADGLGRFRVNIMHQKGMPAVVMRLIPTTIPDMSELHLPEVIRKLALLPRGLVLVVGSTGSGKSTTLAAIIKERNEVMAGHIITVEDPIEFVHTHKKSMVHQREVGLDASSWEGAIKNALRQAPDVVVIGEIRDQETLESALKFSETGHLCFATLHANNASQAIDRMLNMFSEERKSQILIDLAFNLQGVISQRLLPKIEGGRHPAIEVMVRTPYISSLIEKGEIGDIREAMDKGAEEGMKTFDQAVFELFKNGIVHEAVALRYADSENDVRLKIQLGKDTSVMSANTSGNSGVIKLSLVKEVERR